MRKRCRNLFQPHQQSQQSPRDAIKKLFNTSTVVVCDAGVRSLMMAVILNVFSTPMNCLCQANPRTLGSVSSMNYLINRLKTAAGFTSPRARNLTIIHCATEAGTSCSDIVIMNTVGSELRHSTASSPP